MKFNTHKTPRIRCSVSPPRHAIPATRAAVPHFLLPSRDIMCASEQIHTCGSRVLQLVAHYTQRHLRSLPVLAVTSTVARPALRSHSAVSLDPHATGLRSRPRPDGACQPATKSWAMKKQHLQQILEKHHAEEENSQILRKLRML